MTQTRGIGIPWKYKKRHRSHLKCRGFITLSSLPSSCVLLRSFYIWGLLLILLYFFLFPSSVITLESPFQNPSSSRPLSPGLVLPFPSSVPSKSSPLFFFLPSSSSAFPSAIGSQTRGQSSSPTVLWNFTTSHNLYKDDPDTWTQNVSGIGFSVPVLGDVDNDGVLEVAFGSYDRNIYVLNVKNGTKEWNFPISMPWVVPDTSPSLVNLDTDPMLEMVIAASGVYAPFSTLYAFHAENGSLHRMKAAGRLGANSPLVIDINNDSQFEVLARLGDGFYAFDANLAEIWPKPFPIKSEPHSGAWGRLPMRNGVVGDITSDGTREVVFAETSGENSLVYALNVENGKQVWNFTLDQGPSYSGVVLASIDGDQTLEVIVVDRYNQVYALNGTTGEEIWRYDGRGWGTDATPTLGDIDNDRKLEIILSCYNGSSKIYALNAETGTLLWDQHFPGAVHSSLTLCDLDEDNNLELVFGQSGGEILALNAEDGTKIWTYPLLSAEAGAIQIFSSALVADIANDKHLELLISTYGSTMGSNPHHLGVMYALDLGTTGSRIYWEGVRGTTGPALSTNLLDIDPDMDFLSSYSENLLGTDPNDNDTDNDGLWDGWEVAYKLDPLIPDNSAVDSDQDGLTDQQEHDLSREYDWAKGLNPFSNDTDGDGVADNVEVIFYTLDLPQFKVDPTNPDTDGDDLTDGEELFIYGTDPVSNDSDIDGLADGAEIAYGTRPRNPDSDNDRLKDGEEVYVFLTDPLHEDTDRDGLKDGVEVNLDFDPTDEDMDDDGLTDGEEIYDYQTDPRLNDTDGDDLLDGWEVDNNLDPNDADTDGDGDPDGLEVGGWLLDPRDPLWNTTTRLWLMIGVPTVLLSGLLGVITYKKREIIRRRLRRWWIRLGGIQPLPHEIMDYAEKAREMTEKLVETEEEA